MNDPNHWSETQVDQTPAFSCRFPDGDALAAALADLHDMPIDPAEQAGWKRTRCCGDPGDCGEECP